MGHNKKITNPPPGKPPPSNIPASITVALSSKATLLITPGTANGNNWAWKIQVFSKFMSSGVSNDLGGAKAAGTQAWYALGSP
jgi:hypothetical protein